MQTNTNKFSIEEAGLEGVFLIHLKNFTDRRGSLVKVFEKEVFAEFGINSEFNECYLSTSPVNTLRGLHFQVPPYGHTKLITVLEGEILDVIVGVDPQKSSFGKVLSTKLTKDINSSLYVPEGYAHGFLVVSEVAVVMNHSTGFFRPEYESGVRYDSIDFEWPVKHPILSEKDENQKTLVEISKLLKNNSSKD